MKRFISIAFFLCLVVSLQAQEVYTTKNIPKVHLQDKTRYACNPAGILSAEACDDIDPIRYALGRIWDTAIGLSVGMAINMLVFPYDNSRKIRQTVESLDRELVLFLEEMFDGDQVLPDAEAMNEKISGLK